MGDFVRVGKVREAKQAWVESEAEVFIPILLDKIVITLF
jgi:hypothetical protein